MKELLGDIVRKGFGRPWQTRAMLVSLSLVLFFFPFSLLFVAGGLLPQEFGWMASVIILLNGSATFLSELRVRSVFATAITFLTLAGGLFAIELLGVRTGFPFGQYEYTAVLGFSVLGVPVAISVAWYTTIMNTKRIAGHTFGSGTRGSAVLTIVSASLLTVLLDVLLEPMATSITGYWLWEGGSIPFRNYVSWFVISLAAVAMLTVTDRKRHALVPAMYHLASLLYAMQVVLFAVTCLVYGYVLPVLIATAMLLAGIVLRLAYTGASLRRASNQ